MFVSISGTVFIKKCGERPLPLNALHLICRTHNRRKGFLVLLHIDRVSQDPSSDEMLYSASARAVMKPLLFVVCVVFAFGGLRAQTPAWQPSSGHQQVPIWPGAAPDEQPVAGPEVVATTGKDSLVVDRPWVSVGHVSRPTMTVYSPTGKNTGAAVVVFPGGGYQILAIDLEGTEVCDWLTSKGITCVLLKYRVPGEESYPKSAPYPKSGPYPESPVALEDAQRTVGLVRFRAVEWHIDPHKIGVPGFSAGGHLVAAMSTHFAKRLYPPMDAADKESCRPDFAVAIYPGHLSLSAAEWDANQGPRKFVVRHSGTADKHFALNPDIPVTSQTPSTFLLQAEDDHVDDVSDSLAYYIALKNAGVPRGDAFVCTGRACVRAAAHEASDNGMASVCGDVAADDWDDFGLAALGLHMRNGSGNPLSSGIAKKVVRSKLAKW
jgi:acetyl esterase/lipase